MANPPYFPLESEQAREYAQVLCASSLKQIADWCAFASDVLTQQGNLVDAHPFHDAARALNAIIPHAHTREV